MFPTKILLATDGLAESALAEDAAVELATGTGSELHVVCAVSTTPELPYPRPSLRERSEALLEARRLNGLRVLDDRMRRVEDFGGFVAASHYREGDPEKEVVRLSEEISAGLILVGGRKRPWFKRVFGAGFSERLYRRSDRPVLVVNEQAPRRSSVPK